MGARGGALWARCPGWGSTCVCGGGYDSFPKNPRAPKTPGPKKPDPQLYLTNPLDIRNPHFSPCKLSFPGKFYKKMPEIDVTPQKTPDFILQVPESISRYFLDIPRALLEQNEQTLVTMLQPNETMQLLRIRFWSLVAQARSEGRRFTLEEWSTGICAPEFLSRILSDNRYLAWVSVPRQDYDSRVEALLDQGYLRMKEILDMPMVTEEGKVDVKAAGLVLQVVKMLDMRKHGGYLQRIEEKSMQLHGNVKDAGKMFSADKKGSLAIEDIDKKIAELEGKLSGKSVVASGSGDSGKIVLDAEFVDE